MLYLLPLESLEERYTIWMHKWLLEEADRMKLEYTVIEGTQLTTTIETGAFLDCAGTSYYKASQLMRIAELFRDGKVQNGDKFYLYDLQFPGVEMIKYMAMFSKIDVEVYGSLHAGTWTPSDFICGLLPWIKYTEVGWINMCDGAFVGTEFHKQAIEKSLSGLISDKIVVTGHPYNYEDVFEEWMNELDRNSEVKVVLFPTRPHAEKGFWEFLHMAVEVGRVDKDAKFIVTGGGYGDLRCDTEALLIKWDLSKTELGDRLEHLPGLTKANLYKLMGRASVVYSAALQENFGYAVLEAMTCGVLPVLPNRVSYPELVDGKPMWLYDTYDQSVDMVKRFLLFSGTQEQLLRRTVMEFPKKWQAATRRIFEAIGVNKC